MSELKGMNLVVGADITGVTKGMADAKKELAAVAIAAQKLDSSLGSMGKGSNQAANAMMNFGRIVQDAPYGIIGITNNINPLLESFQRLKAETGSTGGALKALAGSLMGAGGLGFAVSIVSSLLTVFALNSRSAGTETKEHKAKVDETKKAADEYASAVGAASSAVISHQGKLTELNAVLRDTSNNFNVLSKSIINQALSEYLATQKEGLIKKILDAKVKEILAAQTAMSKVREFTSKDLFSKDPLKKQIAEAGADLKNLNNLVNSLGLSELFAGIFKLDPAKKVKDIRTIQDVLDDLQKQMVFIKEKNELVGTEKTKANIAAIESALDELLKKFQLGTKNKIVLDLAFQINKANHDTLSSEFIAREIEKMKSDGPKRTINITPKIAVKPILFFESANFTAQMTEKALELQKAFKEFSDKINGTLEAGLENSLAGFGEAIGAAVSEGDAVLPRLFDGIISGLGAQLKELGKSLIQTGTIMKVAKAALEKLFANPIAQVVAGVGLIALGGILQAQVRKKAPGFATGARGFSGGMAMVGERGPELVQLPKGANVLTNGQTNAIGPNEIFISGEFVQRGTDMVMVFDKVRSRNSRNGF